MEPTLWRHFNALHRLMKLFRPPSENMKSKVDQLSRFYTTSNSRLFRINSFHAVLFFVWAVNDIVWPLGEFWSICKNWLLCPLKPGPFRIDVMFSLAIRRAILHPTKMKRTKVWKWSWTTRSAMGVVRIPGIFATLSIEVTAERSIYDALSCWSVHHISRNICNACYRSYCGEIDIWHIE